MRITHFTAAAIVLGACFNGGLTADESQPPLIKVVLNEGRWHVGEMLEETDEQLKLYELSSGQVVTIDSSNVLRITRGLSEEAALRYCSLVDLITWKVSNLPSRERQLGKVATVTPTAIYVTIGSEAGVDTGSQLSVYRTAREIKDPDTGEVLAVERPQIARIEVFEVREKHSKAKLLGDLETPLKKGDKVELPARENRIAVLPIRAADTSASSIGDALAEEMATRLVKQKVKIVERSLLADAIAELALQKSSLFDQNSAQRVGRHLGATAVLAGKITSDAKFGKAFVRLIDVETGEVILAASSQLKSTDAGATGAHLAESDDGGRGSAAVDILKHVDPTKHTILGSWSKAKDGSVVNDGRGIVRSGPQFFCPVELTGDYDCAIDFTMETGDGAIILAFPVDGGEIRLGLNGEWGKGKEFYLKDLGTRIKGSLKRNHKYTITCSIRHEKTSVRAETTIDGKPLLKGEWKKSDLVHPANKPVRPKMILIKTVGNSSYRISEVKVAVTNSGRASLSQ